MPAEARSAAPTADTRFWAPLAHRDYTLLVSGSVVSYLGDSVQLYGQAWLVAEMTGSALALGSVGLAQALPRLLLGTFAGVVVDRLDRRSVMLGAQAATADGANGTVEDNPVCIRDIAPRLPYRPLERFRRRAVNDSGIAVGAGEDQHCGPDGGKSRPHRSW